MVRVRFAPSPTGSLHLGSALTAVANRTVADERGGALVLRIDDTNVEDASEAESAIVEDLAWLGIAFDEGPVRQSERLERHREAAGAIGTEDEAGAARFGRITLLRPDGRPTYHLASVVDDVDLRITHVIRGKDHLSNQHLHEELARALGAEPPEFVHHGLLVGADGRKLSKRHGAASLADLREQGVPPEAVRAYLEELGLPRGDVHFDAARLRRLAVEAIGALTDEELVRRLEIPNRLVPAVRGARDLVEARQVAGALLTAPEAHPTTAPETLERFRELRTGTGDELDPARAKEIVRELKAVGGDLRALRLALTGAERGPELWAVLLALSRDEALRRADAALTIDGG
jgi:tRNA synthetases class I (E and Q), catalytic domain